jgi:hypothetical protein
MSTSVYYRDVKGYLKAHVLLFLPPRSDFGSHDVLISLLFFAAGIGLSFTVSIVTTVARPSRFQLHGTTYDAICPSALYENSKKESVQNSSYDRRLKCPALVLEVLRKLLMLV